MAPGTACAAATAGAPPSGSGQFDASRFVTHTFPLEKVYEAFELARDYSDGVIKAVINP